MNNFVKTVLVAFAALVFSTSVHAATLSLVGGTSESLPGNFSANPHLSATGLVPGDLVTVFDSSNSSSEGLALSGTATIQFEYLGTEAGYTNQAIELAGLGVLFNNKTSSVGDKVTLTLSPIGGLLPFKFVTSGGGGQEAVNGAIDSPLAIAYSAITNNSVIALFGDGAGDHDFDDMAIRISVVPLPPALVLFGAALFGLGWLGKKRKTA